MGVEGEPGACGDIGAETKIKQNTEERPFQEGAGSQLQEALVGLSAW